MPSSIAATLKTDEQLLAFIKKCHEEILERHAEKKAAALKEALQESRDAILARAPNKTPRHFSRRLPTSGQATTVSDLLLRQPCEKNTTTSASTNHDTDDGTDAKGNTAAVAVAEPLSDEVKEAAVSDEAKESVDTADSAQQPEEDEAKEEADDTGAAQPPDSALTGDSVMLTSTTDEHSKTTTFAALHTTPSTISVVFQNPSGHRSTTILPAMPLEGTHEPRPLGTTPAFLKAHFATEDERALTFVPYFGDDDDEDLYSELYNTERRERMMAFGAEYQECETLNVIADTLQLAKRKLGKNAPNLPQERMESALATLLKLDVELLRNRPNEAASPMASPKKPQEESDYLTAVDSYRQCFCRRCFTYDCNLHGCVKKPDVKLQGELALEKERSGYWKQDDATTQNAPPAATATMESGSGEPPQSANAPNNKRSLADAVARLDNQYASMTELTAPQKSICERTFLIHQGDYDKIALTLGAPRKLVVDYVTSQGMNLKDYEHIRPEPEPETKKRKASKNSMKSYNPAWLKRVEGAEIHPFFEPCEHEGPCSEETCSCIKNRFFCTKHCQWGEKSRNFFRGCSCKAGCRTKSCPCYAAKRECDPDLCLSCGACSDPPGEPAMTQRCRNDSIGMRRHCQLLLAKSTIENAGYGMFTKHALKKGDYIHEYIGEVISQEEAERRGTIYDKMNLSYLFNLSSDLVVDASRMGNKTRFVNHSDKPNCEIKMTWVNGDIRIGLFAAYDIDAQSELFFDYRYEVGMDNELIQKRPIEVEWMKDASMANKVSSRKVGS